MPRLKAESCTMPCLSAHLYERSVCLSHVIFCWTKIVVFVNGKSSKEVINNATLKGHEVVASYWHRSPCFQSGVVLFCFISFAEFWSFTGREKDRQKDRHEKTDRHGCTDTWTHEQTDKQIQRKDILSKINNLPIFFFTFFLRSSVDPEQRQIETYWFHHRFEFSMQM